MNNETTSINVNGIPIDTAVKIRRLAAAETKGKNAPMVVILIQEALRRRNSMLAKEIGYKACDSRRRRSCKAQVCPTPTQERGIA